MKKNIYAFLMTSFIIFGLGTITSCSDDDDIIPGTGDNRKIVPVTKTAIKGVFIDSPVQGLTYTSGDTTGVTDSIGTFKYNENTEVSFSVGGITVGQSDGKDTITPIDLVENGDINNQVVKNIAAFLQSLDSDNDPSNGILINDLTNQALNDKTFEFNSDNFLMNLKELIDTINNLNNSSLSAVTPNDAGSHLAEGISEQNDFEILPRIIQGREWEEGEYYADTTFRDVTKIINIIKIGNDLNDIRFISSHNSTGTYFNVRYVKDTLYAVGNPASELHSEQPIIDNTEIRSEIFSPGIVFDYNNSTFLGYSNHYKIEGELGKLPGTYFAMVIYGFQFSDPSINIPDSKVTEYVIIDSLDENDNFQLARRLTFWNDNEVTFDETYYRSINKEEINNEQIMLIRFQNTDYLFSSNNYKYSFLTNQFYATKD